MGRGHLRLLALLRDWSRWVGTQDERLFTLLCAWSSRMRSKHEQLLTSVRNWLPRVRPLWDTTHAPSHSVLRAIGTVQVVLLVTGLTLLTVGQQPTGPALACTDCATVTGTLSAAHSDPPPPGAAPARTSPDSGTGTGPQDTTPDGANAASPDPAPDGDGSASQQGNEARPQDPDPTTPLVDTAEAGKLAFPTHDERARVRSRAQRPTTARRMPHGYYAAYAHDLIAAVPPLEVLQRELPPSSMTRQVEAQKARIAWLAQEVNVTVEGFEAFTVDRSRRAAFADLPHYQDRIRPELFIIHWTGVGYTDVDHFIRSLRPYRVQYFLDREAQVYELFEGDDHKPAHALGANDFSQGVEIETGAFDDSESPLFHYTPAQIEQTIYLAVDFLRRNDLAVDETTLLGHYAADLIFSNPHYDPHSGTLVRPTVRKFDPPQELMQVLVDKAGALDAALDRT